VSRWFETYGFAPVGQDLIIGAYPLDADDVAAIAAHDVQRVVNLCRDEEYEYGEREAVAAALAAAGIAEERMQLIDYAGISGPDVDRGAGLVNARLDAGERVYLHCRAGWQRSATIAAAVIALREHVDVEEALQRLRERKPTAEPLPAQRAGLRLWWSVRSRRPA
jgi:protein-tyrosine phosphatase